MEAQELTARQQKLLKSIVEKYVETASPVGSETLEREASLGVSPATLRNEMVKLTNLGILSQPHTSAGRIPTADGFRFYINNLMDQKQLAVKDEVTIKEKLWDDRHERRRILKDAAQALADKTHALGVAMTSDDTYYSGLANILDMPEFYDIDVTRTLLSMLDQTNQLVDIFFGRQDDLGVHVVFGTDLDDQFLQPCSFVYSRFSIGDGQGVVGVIGPSRLNYPAVIPTVRYLSNLMEELAPGW
ncbi:hypothetical protein HY388_01195 [Candidatus Daviesbacteria bacterium]|nr:hypothetical protein [Candidatus Daviesbacteria bacterium]